MGAPAGRQGGVRGPSVAGIERVKDLFGGYQGNVQTAYNELSKKQHLVTK